MPLELPPLTDQTKYIPGHGPVNAKLMIVGESPSFDELRTGMPFTGPSGAELNRLCIDSGINRQSCWITNVSKLYVPPPPPLGKKKPFQIRAKEVGIDLQQQIYDLQNEINEIEPNCILALGGTALWALTGKGYKDEEAKSKKKKGYGIKSYRGSILHGGGRKLVPTYHPAHLLHSSRGGEFKGYWNRQVMVFDFKRALEQSEFPDIRTPRRSLNICRNSAQLIDFINRYKGYTKPAVDIEADGTCIPACIGFSFLPHEGLTVPLWGNNDYVHIPDSDMISMWNLIDWILNNHDIVGQNFKYDQDKIRRLGFTIRSLASDTMLKAFAINPELPKGLAFNTSIFTEEPFYKDDGMYEGSTEDLYKGCALDSCVTKEIDMKMDADIDELGLRDFYNNFLIKLHDLYSDIEQEGFTIDYKKRDFLFDKYVKWSEKLNYELFKLAGREVNTGSWQQVRKLLFDDFKCPPRLTTGEEDLTDLLNVQGKTGVHNPEHRRAIEIILEKRKVDKAIDTSLLAIPDYDGKMKTTYYLCLETGRTATGQLDPPMRPLVDYRDEDNKLKHKAMGFPFQTMTKHGDIGPDIRSQYIAENGHIFVQADKAQAEARVVFLLADDEQALEDIDKHDYHALTASWFFGGTEDDYSKKALGYESPIRFAGKTLRHAGHLGAAKKRAAISVNTDARKYRIIDPTTGEYFRISEAFAERALKVFHMKQPKIQKVFQNEIVESLQRDNRFLTAPVPYGVDSKIGGKRQFFERWGEELFRQAYSYIPQRAITDSTKADALRIKKKIRQIRIIMESHDALLFMIPEIHLDEWSLIIREEMQKPIRFDTCSIPRRDLIVPCELEIGYDYQNLSKFKFKERAA